MDPPSGTRCRGRLATHRIDGPLIRLRDPADASNSRASRIRRVPGSRDLRTGIGTMKQRHATSAANGQRNPAIETRNNTINGR